MDARPLPDNYIDDGLANLDAMLPSPAASGRSHASKYAIVPLLHCCGWSTVLTVALQLTATAQGAGDIWSSACDKPCNALMLLVAHVSDLCAVSLQAGVAQQTPLMAARLSA